MHEAEWWTMGPGTVQVSSDALTAMAVAALQDHGDACPGCGAEFVARAESCVREWRRDHAEHCDALREKVTP